MVGSPGDDPIAAPVALAAGKVVWIRARARFGEPREVVAATPGAPEEVILRGPPVRGSASEQLGFLVAAGDTVAVTLTDFVRSESGVSVGESGVWAGPARPELARLPVVREGELARDVALGRGSVFVLAGAERSAPRLVARDLATGEQRERRLSRDAGAMTAAGRFVAILEQRGHRDLTRITVRHVRTWKARTRVTVTSDLIEIGTRLRSDGTLVVVYGAQRLKLAVVPPGARRLRRVRGARPSSYQVALHRGAPVIAQRSRRGERLVRAAPGARVRPLTPAYREINWFAAAGSRVAWATDREVLVAAAS